MGIILSRRKSWEKMGFVHCAHWSQTKRSKVEVFMWFVYKTIHLIMLFLQINFNDQPTEHTSIFSPWSTASYCRTENCLYCTCTRYYAHNQTSQVLWALYTTCEEDFATWILVTLFNQMAIQRELIKCISKYANGSLLVCSVAYYLLK